ncbi:hypothetical protein SUDANB145_01611 [Streptomyces sp. enrichment culture]
MSGDAAPCSSVTADGTAGAEVGGRLRKGSWARSRRRSHRHARRSDHRWPRPMSGVLFGQFRADADLAGRVDRATAGVDSTSCRPHRHVVGSRKANPLVPGKRKTPRRRRLDGELVRSRGGRTLKTHVAGEGGCRPVELLPTPGRWGDAPRLTKSWTPWADGPGHGHARSRRRRQAEQPPPLPAKTSHPAHHLRAEGPTVRPPTLRWGGRQAHRLRSGPLPAAQRSRADHQPAQELPRGRRSWRRTGLRLPRRRHHGSDPPVASPLTAGRILATRSTAWERRCSRHCPATAACAAVGPALRGSRESPP